VKTGPGVDTAVAVAVDVAEAEAEAEAEAGATKHPLAQTKQSAHALPDFLF
jgi:hypothetical protein